MIIGVTKEIKEGENRVAVTPANVERMISHHHTVLIENLAGDKAGFSNEDYIKAGAAIVNFAEEVFGRAELMVKVKEILPEEFGYLRETHTIMTYIHSANRLPQTEAILNSKAVAFAYEDVRDENGEFPLLTPMSEIAGTMGLLLGVTQSFTTQGGSGKLMGGAPGADNSRIIVFGAGNVGLAAAKLAVNFGADVTILDIDHKKLRDIKNYLLPQAKTLYSNKANILAAISSADMVINGVKWIPGLTLISRNMLKHMKPNALIVDIDAEPGGAIETSQYSTIDNPVFVVDGIRHIGVPNLPSMVANSSSTSLSNSTIPYVLQVADKGWLRAARENKALRHGLDFVKGRLTFKPTAEAFNLVHHDIDEVLASF